MLKLPPQNLWNSRRGPTFYSVAPVAPRSCTSCHRSAGQQLPPHRLRSARRCAPHEAAPAAAHSQQLPPLCPSSAAPAAAPPPLPAASDAYPCGVQTTPTPHGVQRYSRNSAMRSRTWSGSGREFGGRRRMWKKNTSHRATRALPSGCQGGRNPSRLFWSHVSHKAPSPSMR